MEYNRSDSREKWTIMMYMRDFNLMVTYAYALRYSNKLSGDNIDEILLKMEEDGIYHPRNGGSTFTGQFKSIQIAWYMFGYYNKSRAKNEEKKMVFSPLGNLLLDNMKDKDKARKIFLTMLYANGFRQPFSQMDARFNLFPYRLVLKLLRDPRLGGKLYNDEVFYYAMFIKEIDDTVYEELVSDILAFRKVDPYTKLSWFKENEAVVGLANHEWSRYATGMMESAGIVSVRNDHDNRRIGTLCYGNISPKTGKHNAQRSYTENYIVLAEDLVPYVDLLLSKYPYDQKPFSIDEITTKFNSDIVVELYSFYPPELLTEIGIESEEDHALSDMLTIANNITYYSREETETGAKFEYALRDAFNLFIDVDAERVGGSGQPDVECIFHKPYNPDKKFDIEAKSTSTKLQAVNPRRLRTHRALIGSVYTIVVAPNYARGVLSDIRGEKTVVVKAAVLANYFYQYIIKHGRNLSYAHLDWLVASNLGKDISDSINKYVYEAFGHAAQDFSIA